MAVLTQFKIKGDADELLAFKREHLDPIFEPTARENGILEHVVCRADDGLLIVNVWETLEGSERTAAVVGPKAREAGSASPPTEWQANEILQRETG